MILEFNCGLISIKQSRKGHPKLVVVLINTDAVRELLELDRHFTYRETQKLRHA